MGTLQDMHLPAGGTPPPSLGAGPAVQGAGSSRALEGISSASCRGPGKDTGACCLIFSPPPLLSPSLPSSRLACVLAKGLSQPLSQVTAAGASRKLPGPYGGSSFAEEPGSPGAGVSPAETSPRVRASVSAGVGDAHRSLALWPVKPTAQGRTEQAGRVGRGQP